MTNDFTVTTVDLLRHGQCDGGEIFRGSTDVSLTETGWQQMLVTVNEPLSWDHVFSSSLIRCRAFSEYLSAQRSTPLAVFDELQEIHFGDWEGVEFALIQQKHQMSLQAFWADPLNNTPPNAESIVDFRNRVLGCFEKIIEGYKGKHLLFVTHGAVVRVLMCELLNMPLSSMSKLSVPYACLTRFKLFSASGKDPWIQLCFHRGE
ncbi:MAG: alpha-ribazole phosphatase family protein [Spongiibacteraceae bacterium]|nr:alpha-ribazole phosphatase family protein [Spongiibacteraceae bacterium]